TAGALFDLPGSWSDAGTMGVARTYAQAHALTVGNKVLVYGGGVSSAELWDSGAWTAAGSTTVAYGNSILLPGHKIVAVGGRTIGDATRSAEGWRASAWSTTGSLVEAVSLAQGAPMGTNVLIAGGYGASSSTATVQRFDGATWTKASPMSASRYAHTMTA